MVSVVVNVATVMLPVSVPATALMGIAWAVKVAGVTVQGKILVVSSPYPSSTVTDTSYGVVLTASSAIVPEIIPVFGSMDRPSGRFAALKSNI